MADPLAGQRRAINDRETERLLWPDEGKGCPVEVGEVFKLATCHIEITRCQRVQRGREWLWRSEFRRIYGDGGVFLLSRAGGYTEDPKLAMRAQDDPEAGTVTGDPLENPRNTESPPEPEAIPPHEVATLPTSVAARVRFERLRAAASAARLQRALIEEIRRADLGIVEIEELREAVRERREAA
jgi:hypothetical protein